MKKYFILLIVLLPSFWSCSRCISGDGNVISENRNVSSFHSIVLNSAADIFLSSDSAEGIRIEAETALMPEITTTLSNGKLSIGSRVCIKPKKPIKIYCSMKELRMVELNGAGNITSANTFPSSSGQLEVVLDGAGNISLGSNAQKIITTVNGAGDVTLKGGTAIHKIRINGSGNIHAFDLSSNTSEVSISGAGDVEVSASKTLDANISGSGDIYYKGEPETHISKNGSGTVKKK